MKKRGIKSFIFIAVCWCMFFSFNACTSNADLTIAPDFTLLDLNQKTYSLSDYKGKMVILNFFATYCPPCRAEMPDFVRLQQKYGDKGLQFLAISADSNWHEVLPSFIKKMNINFPILLATSKVIKDYGDVYGLPVTFVIGKDRKIVTRIMGMVEPDELEHIVQKHLGS